MNIYAQWSLIGSWSLWFVLSLCYLVCLIVQFSLLHLDHKIIDEQAAKDVRKQKHLGYLMDHLPLVLKMIDILKMMLLLIIGAVLSGYVRSIDAVSHIAGNTFYQMALILGSVLIVYVLLIESFTQLVVVYFPQKILNTLACPLVILYKIFKPFLALMSWIIRACFLFKADPKELHLDNWRVRWHLKMLLPRKSFMSPFLKDIVLNAVKFRGLEASDILVPRNQVQYLNLKQTDQENEHVMKDSGYTRFPLCEGDLNHCIGFIHIKDVFAKPHPTQALNLLELKRPISRFSVHTPLETILQRFLKLKIHMALIVDEFESTVGIITLEHLLEELVGSIEDEFDTEEDTIRQIQTGIYSVSGLTPVHELETHLKLVIDNHEVSTLGGLITAKLGRIPSKDERIDFTGFRVIIDEVDLKRIIMTTLELNTDSEALKNA